MAAIPLQCLILHDVGNAGDGTVIAFGYTDMTKDAKYIPATTTVQTDCPYGIKIAKGMYKAQTATRWESGVYV